MRRRLSLAVLAIISCGRASHPTAPAPEDAAATDAGPSAGDASVPTPDSAAPETIVLFDGILSPDWKMTTIVNQPGRDDPGHFEVRDGALVAFPGTDLGMLWNSRPTPADFVLELEWRLSQPNDNSGVFVRFPDPTSKGYDNTAFVAIDFGYEIQIDELGEPDGKPEHTTGAIYGETAQSFNRVVAKPPGEWNAFSIHVEGDVFSTELNGQPVARFVNPSATRGVSRTAANPTFIGLQTHDGNVAFRKIRLRALP